jgi:hypothetical protein
MITTAVGVAALPHIAPIMADGLIARVHKRPKDELHIAIIACENTEGNSSILNNHRNYFFKCYTQLLQKQTEAKGEVFLNFTIENSGKISSCEVNSQQMKDESFHRCLKEVMMRIEFMPFKGPAISTLFPLKFE